MSETIYSPEFVKDLFNPMSASYERMNYITSFGFSIRWRKQCVQLFGPSQDEIEIVDMLTGMGETWNTVKKQYPNSRITAIDFSPGMLKSANHKNESKFNNQIEIIQEDILRNRLPENHFDLIICAFGLKTFDKEQLKTLAEETKRVLKPNGRFSFVEVSKPANSILKMLYGLYLGKMIPVLGKILLGNPREYRMLWRYTLAFKNAREACNIFRSVGLQVQYKEYFYGCATGFHGSKPTI